MKEPKDSDHKKIDKAQMRFKRAAELQLFAKKYARRAQKNVEPNDRKYNRAIESVAKKLKPEELDRLLRLGEDD